MHKSTRFWTLLKLVTAAGLLSAGAQAAADTGNAGIRYEAAIGIHSLDGITELRPVGQGEFDELGFNLGGAVHWPYRRDDNHDLRFGFDFGFFASGSNISFITDDLITRGGYLVPSLKWKPGAGNRFSLDAGLGFYLVDIAELAGDYPWTVETEVWEESAIGGFIGVTWDFVSAGSAKNRGLMLSFKVHFFDLGTVRDEDPALPVTLGTDAGSLSDGMYQLQLGYRWE